MPLMKKGSKKLLDNKKCFLYWLEIGTLDGASERMATEGIVNPRTGKPFSDFGIRHAAYVYILENSDEARTLMGCDSWEDEEWDLYLIQRAKSILLWSSTSRFMNWIRKMGFEKYEWFYEEKFKEKSIKRLGE